MDSPLAAAFIEANAAHRGGANGPISRIVIHGTVSQTVRGGARGNAHYFQSAAAGGAAHYVVDPDEIVCCVHETEVAHHAPPNTGSIGIELCDPVAGDPARWQDQPHAQMLGLASKLVRDVADRNSVPIVWLSPSDLLAGRHGITSHANVSAAWHRTDHTDPGVDFPVDAFMALVRGDAPTPSPSPVEDDPMFITEFADFPGKLWLVEVTNTATPAEDTGNVKPYGTRQHIRTPDEFHRLSEHGVRVLSGKQLGGTLYTEAK